MEWRLRRAGAGDARALSLVAAATFLETFVGIIAGPDMVRHCSTNSSPTKFDRWIADPQCLATLAEHRDGAAPVGYTLLTQPDLAEGERLPMKSVPQVINAVERGEVDLGFVPLENSIEGSVSVTLDTLAFDTDLLVQREVDLPVSLNLCAPAGVGLSLSPRPQARAVRPPRLGCSRVPVQRAEPQWQAQSFFSAGVCASANTMP